MMTRKELAAAIGAGCMTPNTARLKLGLSLVPPRLTSVQKAELLGDEPAPSWTDQLVAEVRLASNTLHNLSIETAAKHPCLSAVLKEQAERFDELLKGAPR